MKRDMEEEDEEERKEIQERKERWKVRSKHYTDMFSGKKTINQYQ